MIKGEYETVMYDIKHIDDSAMVAINSGSETGVDKRTQSDKESQQR